jgi:hypothetical protein
LRATDFARVDVIPRAHCRDASLRRDIDVAQRAANSSWAKGRLGYPYDAIRRAAGRAKRPPPNGGNIRAASA